MKIREILSNLIGEIVGYYRDDNGYADQALSDIHKAIVDGMPKENNYAKGLVEDIGALSMSMLGPERGFKEYKELKKIDGERNVGYNQYRTEMLKVLDKLFKENK